MSEKVTVPVQCKVKARPANAFAALIVANLFLAAGPWMVRLADTGPTASAFWRMALAAPLLVLLAVRSGSGGGRDAMTPALVGAILLGGLFFAADLAAWHYGILRTKLANATLFGNMSSFLFAGYGFLMLRTLPSRLQGTALAVAGIGAALLLGSSYDLSPRHLEGDLWALLAALFYAFYLIVVDRARRDMSPMPVMAIATLGAALPLLALAAALGEQLVPGDWTPLILYSLSSQVIGQGLLVYAMGHLSPLVVGLGLLTQPVVTALIGWIVYDERLGAVDFTGALLICAALIMIRLPDRRRAAT